MKTGIILYVTQGKERLLDQNPSDVRAVRRQLDAEAVSVATSEDEIADAWWRMVARGMHRVGCVPVRFHAESGRLEPTGRFMRLSG
jgi:hypothetical protein